MIIFAVFLTLMILAVARVSKVYNQQSLIIVKQSVQRAAVECYSVEGIYPPNIEYLKDNYSLSYNSDKYYVFYETFASNVMPTIEVYERK